MTTFEAIETDIQELELDLSSLNTIITMLVALFRVNLANGVVRR